jgi:hypothetical protein
MEGGAEDCRACHTRLVVPCSSCQKMKSDRPAGGAIGCRCMNFQHSLAGLAQTPFRVPRPAHGWRMLVGRQLRNHARAFDPRVRLVPWAMMPA